LHIPTSTYYYSAAEQAINTLFLLHPTADLYISDIIKKLAMEILNLEGNNSDSNENNQEDSEQKQHDMDADSHSHINNGDMDVEGISSLSQAPGVINDTIKYGSAEQLSRLIFIVG